MAVYDGTLSHELKNVALWNHIDFVGIADSTVFDDIRLETGL